MRRNQVVAITGASSGVGRETALAFAHKGAIVVLIALRRGALEHVADQCRPTASAVLVRPADLEDPAAIASAAADVFRRFGRIDVWVNAASASPLSVPDHRDDAAWRRRIEHRLFETYHGVRSVLPYMRTRGRGAVVNVPAVLSRQGEPFQEAFLAGKHATRALTHCLRREVADTPGITVSAVVPGPVAPPRADAQDPHAPLRPIIDPRHGARAVLACARKPRDEIAVDSGAGPLSGLVGAFGEAVARMRHFHGRRDPVAAALGPTMEHSLVLPHEGRRG